jgi:hypothetical protein
MKKIVSFVFVILVTIVLSGCMYPEDLKIENQIPAQDQLDAVQRAINDYRTDTGVLPIKNRDQDTDIFIKYIIDFEKLVPKYISAAPANSYEKGGMFQYIIWNPENNPTVKLVDLRMPEKIRDVKARMMVKEYPQYGESITNTVYTINHRNLGYSEALAVDSPYTNNFLPLVLSNEGEVYVDYSIDLKLLLEEKNLHPTNGQDIRELLVEHYPVVPAYSLPYTVDENNEPVFMQPTETK